MWKKEYTRYDGNGTTSISIGGSKTANAGGGFVTLLWLIDAIFLWLNPTGVPGWVMIICQIFFWIGVIGIIFMVLVIITFAIIWIKNN
jgi:hypothetical protein